MMSKQSLERRVAELERQVAELMANGHGSARDWRRSVGIFTAEEEAFMKQVDKAGKAIRQGKSWPPKRRKKPRKQSPR